MEHDEFGLRTSRRVRASDLRRATGVPGRTGGSVKYDVAHPPEECHARVAEQRKACTKGQPESAEAERQRQKGQQAQQQRKGDDSLGSEGGERRWRNACSDVVAKELVALGARGTRKDEMEEERARQQAEERVVEEERAAEARRDLADMQKREERKTGETMDARRHDGEKRMRRRIAT